MRMQICSKEAARRKFFQTEIDDDEEEDDEEGGQRREGGSASGEPAPPVPPPRSKSKESSLVNELKSPSRSPNERSVYYDAVAEHSQGVGGSGGGAVKGFATSGGQGRSLGSFRESKNVESVEARKGAVADNLSGSKATSGTSGGDSSESYNSGGNSGSRQQQPHHRHYRHHRSAKASRDAAANAAKPAAAPAPEVERKSLVARRISLDDLSSAFQALVSKKTGSNSSNKSRSSSSASTSAKKQHIVKKARAAAGGGDNHSDNSGVDERSSGRNGGGTGGGGDRYRSRSEESLLDTDEKLALCGMVGGGGGVEGAGGQKMVRSSASPGSGSSPRPPSRTSASRIPLPLRSSASPFNFAAALRGEKEDSVDRYSASSSISDAAGMPMQPQPPSYAVATGGGSASSADYNPPAHTSTTSYLISRYGSAAVAAGGDPASGRYGSYTIYHNPSSHLPHGPHATSEYPVGNPGSRASYAGTAAGGAAKAEYFRGSYPTHYGTSTSVGEDGSMVVGQLDSQISPRWRRRSYDYENMPGAGPPQAQTAMATIRTTTGSGRPLSELASGMARSRSRSRAPTEYTDHGGHGQQHPPPPPPAPPPTTSSIYHHHRYAGVGGGHQIGYRPASNYMYGHAYGGYHIPMGHSAAAVPSSSAAVSAADVVVGTSAGMGIPGSSGQPMEPHPPPAYSRSDREISARLRRYHQQQPTSHN